MTQVLKLAIGSIIVALGVLALKLWAAQITGSVALLSDALESIVNLATAVAALIAVQLAARPADSKMPFGYYKAEYFSAVLEGVFIVVAALLIFYQAWQGFSAPSPLYAPFEGIAISMVATAINWVWSVVLVRQGRRLQSPALEADGHHLWTDVFSSLGVAAGLVLVVVTGQPMLDAALAVLVGLNILWSGSRLLAASVGGLMDISVGTERLDAIRQTIGQGRVHRLPSGGAGRHERQGRARHLRQDRNGAAGSRFRRHHHHPRRARAQGQAFGNSRVVIQVRAGCKREEAALPATPC